VATHTTPALRVDQTSEEGRAFFQQRFATYLLVYGALGGLFLVLRVLGQALAPSTMSRWHELERPDFWAHAGAVGVSLAGWLYARGAPKRRETLEHAEQAFVFMAMLGYVVMGYFTPPEQGATMTVYLATTMGLFARAIFVPSTARLSFVLACAVAFPSIILSYAAFSKASPEFIEVMMKTVHAADPESFRITSTVFHTAWWLGTVVLTTGASHVIFGLRQEVRDAQQLGQYKLEEKLGEGGMGIVYRASHALLQRPTAVKLVPKEKAGERSLARFEREVQLTARLTHPNTITVFDYGHTSEGVFYYAMELLDGATLETVVENTGPIPSTRAAHLLTQTAGALAEAHGIGLIHRDIKPANIMLCEQGGIPDTVKVLDFGLVKDLEQPEDSGLTQGNAITGTPQYMPPEALTDPSSVDARSDIYSLGVVAFFVLTGDTLFSGNVVEVCGHHLHTPPRRVSELVDVPADLDDLVDACLAKDPAERPASAELIVERLEATGLAAQWKRSDARSWWADHAGLVVPGGGRQEASS
jgi:serine/threonine-protein kinase